MLWQSAVKFERVLIGFSDFQYFDWFLTVSIHMIDGSAAVFVRVLNTKQQRQLKLFWSDLEKLCSCVMTAVRYELWPKWIQLWDILCACVYKTLSLPFFIQLKWIYEYFVGKLFTEWWKLFSAHNSAGFSARKRKHTRIVASNWECARNLLTFNELSVTFVRRNSH